MACTCAAFHGSLCSFKKTYFMKETKVNKAKKKGNMTLHSAKEFGMSYEGFQRKVNEVALVIRQ